MSVYKRPRSETYSYDFYRGGRRFSGKTGERERRAAEAAERRFIREVEATLSNARRFAPASITLDAAAERYWQEVAQHTATPAKLQIEMGCLVRGIGPNVRLSAITDAVVSELVAARRQDFVKGDPRRGRISPAHVNRSTTQLLRRILTRAKLVWKEKLPEEPHWRAHILKEPKALVRELRQDEEGRLEAVEREEYRPPRLFAWPAP